MTIKPEVIAQSPAIEATLSAAMWSTAALRSTATTLNGSPAADPKDLEILGGALSDLTLVRAALKRVEQALSSLPGYNEGRTTRPDWP
jgi:hypothetical protein